MNAKILLQVLAASSRRHGPDKPVTLGHLYNLVALAIKIEERKQLREDDEHWKLLEEIDFFGQG